MQKQIVLSKLTSRQYALATIFSGTAEADYRRAGFLLPMSTVCADDFVRLIFVKDVSTHPSEHLETSLSMLQKDALITGRSVYWHVLSASAATFIPELGANFVFERLFYSYQSLRGSRARVERNFILVTPWDLYWNRPLMSPAVLRLPSEANGAIYSTRKQTKRGSSRLRTRSFEGPEDTRVSTDFTNRTVILNFNIRTPLLPGRQMFGLSLTFDELQRWALPAPFISASPKPLAGILSEAPLVQFTHADGFRHRLEKNWTPLVFKGQLYYVYSLSPLRVLQCSHTLSREVTVADLLQNELDPNHGAVDSCVVAFGGEAVGEGMQSGGLRGGTNWLEFGPPGSGIFFGLARSHVKVAI